MEKVLLGMSGGKDSTWACRVLQEKGYEVEGLLLVLHDSAPIREAESAADKLGIKLHIAERRDRFRREVEDHFTSEYFLGRTPNPCVECNKKIKFNTLLEEANRLGIEKISTGHYVRVGEKDGRYYLAEAADKKKDQSYFLWQLTQEMLSRYVSPLEDVTKDEVVQRVTENALLDRISESQEICFIPDDDYVSFLKSRYSTADAEKAFGEGDFVTVDGRTVGRHRGYACYTVGQRKSLGIALGRPAFVVRIEPDGNRVVLGFEEDNVCRGFTADSLNFMLVPSFEGEGRYLVRPRYRSPLVPCNVRVLDGRAEVTLDIGIKSVSPGQSAVFYDELGRVAFGGKIR